LHHDLARPMQIFNQINARSLSDDWNVYSEFYFDWRGSRLFLIIICIEAGLQVNQRRTVCAC